MKTEIINEDREINVFQLILCMLTRWKILLLFMIAGAMIWGIRGLVSVDQTDISNIESGEQAYSVPVEVYDIWIKEAIDVLGEGIPQDIPEGRTKIDMVLDTFELIEKLPLMMSNRAAVRNALNSDIKNEKGLSDANVISGVYDLIKGAVIGIVIGILVLFLYQIMSLQVLSADEMIKRYKSYLLGVVLLGGNINRKILAHGVDGSFYDLSREEQIDMISTKLSIMKPGVHRVLLVGNTHEEDMHEIAEMLKSRMSDEMDIDVAVGINRKSASLQKVKDDIDIVVVETVGESSYRDVDQEILMLSALGKSVIGFIAIG